MSSFVIICAIFLVMSHVSYAVILRPKWYPYFRRDNNQESGSGSGQSLLPTETLARQIRAPEMEKPSLCLNGLASEECVDMIATVISKILQLNNQKYLLY
ncbi:hypothetical protein BsWGS_19139 [Bradybaena similaris]